MIVKSASNTVMERDMAAQDWFSLRGFHVDFIERSELTTYVP